MSERDWHLFLKDIRDCARRTIDYVGTMSRDEFMTRTSSGMWCRSESLS
jgi:uncharacterized protein with HEPN domain